MAEGGASPAARGWLTAAAGARALGEVAEAHAQGLSDGDEVRAYEFADDESRNWWEVTEIARQLAQAARLLREAA